MTFLPELIELPKYTYKSYGNELKLFNIKFNRKLAELEEILSKQNKKILQKDEAPKKCISQIQSLRDNPTERSSFVNQIFLSTTDDLEFDVSFFHLKIIFVENKTFA